MGGWVFCFLLRGVFPTLSDSCAGIEAGHLNFQATFGGEFTGEEGFFVACPEQKRLHGGGSLRDGEFDKPSHIFK